MRWVMVGACLLLAISSVGAAPKALEQNPFIYCPPAPPGTAVDGNLSEIFWQVPAGIPRFINLSGRTPAESTKAWAAYDKQAVYFAMECEQINMPADRTSELAEILLDPDGQRTSLLRFSIDAGGNKAASKNGAPLLEGEAGSWEAAVRVETEKWTAEFRIPRSILGVDLQEGSVLRANLRRYNGSTREISCWTSYFGHYDNPLGFGNMIMGVPANKIQLSANAGDRIEQGTGQVRVWCFNHSDTDIEMVATAYPGGKRLMSDKPLRVQKGKQLTGYVMAHFEELGPINLKLEAVDVGTEEVAAQASFTGTVVPPPAPPTGAVISSKDWGTVWHSIATAKVMRDTDVPTGKTASVKISAAKNEFEPFQLVLRPKKNLNNVRVMPRRLKGPGGAEIPSWSVSARNVQYVYVPEPTSSDVPGGMYPDPLPEFKPFTAQAGVNSPVWITVYVAPDTKPGDYKGTIDILADGIGKVSVPVELHVWDFALPSVSKLRTAFGCAMGWPVRYHGAKTLEEKRRLIDFYNRDFWRHRVAPFSPYTFYEIKTGYADGQIQLDFSDFDLAVQKYFPLFNSYNLPHFRMHDQAGLNMGADYERLKVEYMRMVTEHLVNKGQIEKGYNYIFDEPLPEQYESVLEAARLCRMADSRIKILLTEQVEPELIGSVDIWAPIMDSYEEAPAKERQAAGEEMWWYVCCGPRHPYPNLFIDYPAVDHRVIPWLTWGYGLNGLLYWEVNYWRDNPYTTSMSYTPDGKGKWGNGDGQLLYPPTNDPSNKFLAEGPVPSIRWELVREGIEDYDYFRILEGRMPSFIAGELSPAQQKARQALQMVESCAKSRTDYAKDPMKLQSARDKVAQAIEALGE